MDTVSMLNKMSFYCQPILPLVYDESMSYYETLCKVVGQLNTTGETVNKLNEGLTGEIADRQAADAELDERLTGEISDRRTADAALNDRLAGEIADRYNVDNLLNERLKVVEATNKKIHFLAFAGTPPHNARPVGAMPTRSELRQWINDREMIVTVMETTDEERNLVYATSCTYNAVNWTHENPAGFYIIVPISIDYDSEGDNAVRQKIAKITIPPDPASSLDDDWGLQFIEINNKFTGGKIEGNVEITGGLKVGMSSEFSSSIKAGSEISSDMLLMAPIVALHDPATEESISFGVSGENAAKVTSPVSGGGTQYARLAVGTPTGDNDAATKAYVDSKSVVATDSANGLMSAADKAKLDGIEAGATKTIVDDVMSDTSTNPVQNKAVKAALDGKLSTRGGEISGYLEVGQTVSAEGSVSVGRTSSDTGIHFEKAASDAGRISHGSDAMTGVAPIARLKVATPTEDDDAATKAYVDNNAAGAGAVRYDAAQTLEVAQQFQARMNIGAVGNDSPQFQGFLALAPANAPLGTGVGLSPSGSGNDFTLDISDVNENTPTLLTGVKTPTDADTNAAATVEYVNAKLESGDVTVQNANLLDNNDTANQVQNKVFYVTSSNARLTNVNGVTAIYFPVGKWGAGNYKFPIDYAQYGGDQAYRTALFNVDKGYIKTKTSTAVDTSDTAAYILSLDITQAEIDSGTYYIGLSIRTLQLGTSAMVVKDMDYPDSYIEYGTTTYKVQKLDNELAGKKASFCGDSICAGTSVGTASPIYGQGWAGIIGKKNGMTWQNLGVNGATVAETSSSSGKLIVVNQLEGAYSDADYIILEGGCNDFDQMSGSTDADKMGAITAVWDDSYVKTTFAGALEHLFYTAVTKHPKAKIGYIIPPLMGLRNWTQYETISYRVYFNLAIDICKKWGIPYIDLWYESPLNPNLTVYYDPSLGASGNISDGTKCYVDGQHLTEAGYNLIAPKIEAWMRTL